jgi:hypothetical protein
MQDQVAYLQKLLDLPDVNAEQAAGGDANTSLNSSLVHDSSGAAELSLADTPAKDGSSGENGMFKSADGEAQQEDDKWIHTEI